VCSACVRVCLHMCVPVHVYQSILTNSLLIVDGHPLNQNQDTVWDSSTSIKAGP